ncbi:MAG TPA: M28 family peptidase [Geomonas sp.]|nr:M28 family peptidase [Geomonas sp.]
MAGDAFCREVSVDRLCGHIRALQGVRHPVAAPDQLERAAVYLAATLESYGYLLDEQRFFDQGKLQRNLLASAPGSDPQTERIALLAHYDTVAQSPGADDNASGVAVLLEAARLLAGFRFQKSVQFIAVSLEENRSDDEPDTGTRGSRALAAHAREQGWQLGAVLVLESVGYAGDHVVQSAPPGVPVPVPDNGNFIAVIGNERSPQLVESFLRAIGRLKLDLPCLPLVVPGNGELLPDSRRSDHAPFWDQGYPAIMVTDTSNFRNPNYHRPTDTLETLNLEFAARVCRATVETVIELARLLR